MLATGSNLKSQLNYRRLGRTGLMVSELGLGGHGGKSVEERAIILHRAVELGINYLDNATTEEADLYAKAIGNQRDRWIIGFSSWPERLTADYAAQLTPAGMLANIEARLRAYRTDMLDIWRPVAATWGPVAATWGPVAATWGPVAATWGPVAAAWGPERPSAPPPLSKGGPGGGESNSECSARSTPSVGSPQKPPAGTEAGSYSANEHPDGGATCTQISDRALDMTVAVFDQARRQGKVRFLGLSSHDPALFHRVLRDYPQFSVLFFPYLFCAHPAAENSLLTLAAEQDVGIIGIKPFAAGAAFGDKPSIWRGRVDPRAGALLRIMLQEPRIAAVIPSALLPSQLEENAKAIYTPRLPPTDADHRVYAECLATYHRGLQDSFAGYQWLRAWETL